MNDKDVPVTTEIPPVLKAVPCRSCDSASLDDAGHVYGETKCCPDCDHRPEDQVDRATCPLCFRESHPGAYCFGAL